MESNLKICYNHVYESRDNYKESIERLYEIIKILRKECPWDKEQTHETLRKGMIEEAYEVVEAINNSDKANLKEELGDVLLQVIFHSSLSEENEGFTLNDVINMECEKMIRRHPHVFLEEKDNKNVKTIDKVLEKWENIKAREKNETNISSSIKKVPKALPALSRAYKVQKKAADVGFDWEDISGAFDKIKEETDELIKAYEEAPNNKKDLEEELGDLLFSCVNASRFLKVDPEVSLTCTIDKFIRRFNYVESTALSCGRDLREMSLSEMDELWNRAKNIESSK